MLKVCLVFLKSEPQYAYKHYAYNKKHVIKQEREREKSVKRLWHFENMVDSTDETYNIKGHFYKQISKKGSFEVLNFSDVIDCIFLYSTHIKTLQCQE